VILWGESVKKIIISIMILLLCLPQTACKVKDVVPAQAKENQVTKKPTEKPTKQSTKPESTNSKDTVGKSDETNKESTNNGSTVKTGKDINSLIPNGWRVLEKVKGEPVLVKGDLNKDGISDIVEVIEKTGVDKYTAPRALLIALGNRDETYNLSIIAEKAILMVEQGGVWGEYGDIRFHLPSHPAKRLLRRFLPDLDLSFLLAARLGCIPGSAALYSSDAHGGPSLLPAPGSCGSGNLRPLQRERNDRRARRNRAHNWKDG
jgi:hypothetical protein